MNLNEIKAAIKAGKRVKWKHDGYNVICDKLGQFLIVCADNQSTIGLTWQDGVTLNGEEDEFYIQETQRYKVSVYDGYSTSTFYREGTYDEVSNSCRAGYPASFVLTIEPA